MNGQFLSLLSTTRYNASWSAQLIPLLAGLVSGSAAPFVGRGVRHIGQPPKHQSGQVGLVLMVLMDKGRK